MAFESGVVLNGTDQFLSATNDATLQSGGVDFFVAAWVRRSASGILTIAAKQPTPSTREWILGYDTTGAFATDRLFFRIAGATSAFQVTANTFGALALDTWAFVLAWRDASTEEVGIRVNGTTADTITVTSMVSGTTAPLLIGASQDSEAPTYNRYFNGRIGQAIFGKPSDVAAVLSDLHSTLYGSGDGANYADVTGTQKTNWGLSSWWELDERSGTRFDSHGSNDLTPSGSPTWFGVPRFDIHNILNLWRPFEGEEPASRDGSGSPSAEVGEASGSGTITLVTIEGSGDPSATTGAASGTGQLGYTSTGTASASTGTVSGTGEILGTIGGTGTPSASVATAFGVGLVSFAGTGAVLATAGAVAGSGLILGIISGSGTPSASVGTVSGLGTRGHLASAALTASTGILAGSATIDAAGSGTVTASAGSLAGSGSLGEVILPRTVFYVSSTPTGFTRVVPSPR